MKIRQGDSVLLSDTREVAIVEWRIGEYLTVRIPDAGDVRRTVERNKVRALAEVVFEKKQSGTRLAAGISIAGKSTLSELVAHFGYSTSKLRRDSLEKVCNQLRRAGLEVQTYSGDWGRDDMFNLVLREDGLLPPPKDVSSVAGPALTHVSLPEPFWPTAFGLEPNQEFAFLRALTKSNPILCVFIQPGVSESDDVLQSTWEGMVAWAYRSAQRFDVWPRTDDCRVLVGSPAVLHGYLRPSVIHEHFPILDGSHQLTLVTIKREADLPADFERLRAIWPGPTFRFQPRPALVASEKTTQDLKAILGTLFLAAGVADVPDNELSPLKTLLWCREATELILARASAGWSSLASNSQFKRFKGSSEGASALALKAAVAHWVHASYPDIAAQFEETEVEICEEDGPTKEMRMDLVVKELGRFEIETMRGSGPMEAFVHKKVFSRVHDGGEPLWLVVPNDTILWAGPFLADTAHHLKDRGHVLVPGADETFLEVKECALRPERIEIEVRFDELSRRDGPGAKTRPAGEEALKLTDVAGYQTLRKYVSEVIIWPEKNRWISDCGVRSSGILFFGPPGCGKSRLARAIAGELDQDVRLLGPSDLRGPYVGWGQIMIREQFDWVAEDAGRMLIIDELDAVAHSRRDSDGGMHSDERANVNELLVQLDRATRLGRIIAGTTNFLDRLDEAVVRSGRFGRFVPVPPPVAEESLEILEYYLQMIQKAGQRNNCEIEVPHGTELRGTLIAQFRQNHAHQGFFCCADLEEAVNRAYLYSCRHTQIANGEAFSSQRRQTIRLTCDALTESLHAVRRSVTQDAMRRFLTEVRQNCGAVVSEGIVCHFPEV